MGYGKGRVRRGNINMRHVGDEWSGGVTWAIMFILCVGNGLLNF